MQGITTQYPIAEDHALLWKPGRLDGISLFKARFSRFAFKKHVHQEFAIGVIEYGVQKFNHLGNQYFAAPKTIITVNPDEVHDGMAAVKDGYQYRMVYISPRKIQEMVTGLSGSRYRLGYFKTPVHFDDSIAKRLHHAFLLMEKDKQNDLESHTCLAQAISDLFLCYGDRKPSSSFPLKDKYIVRRACEYILSKLTQNISLEEIAGSVGLSRYHFLRVFKNTTGMPPHAYLILKRTELAKKALENGCSIAEAAIKSGFSDQSHMTRCFKAVYGLPPGRYRKSLFNQK